MYSKARGILLHSRRVSVLPHTQPLSCSRRLWIVDSACQGLFSNVFPHSNSKPDIQSHLPSHLTAAPSVSHTNSNHKDWLDPCSCVSFSLSDGISREPPRLGHEGGAEGQEVAQGGGELHVEHHHTEGEILSHIRQDVSDHSDMWHTYL